MSENLPEIPIIENVEPPEVKLTALTSDTEMLISDSLQKSVQPLRECLETI